jgi:hypothetical protein
MFAGGGGGCCSGGRRQARDESTTAAAGIEEIHRFGSKISSVWGRAAAYIYAAKEQTGERFKSEDRGK